MFKFKIIDNFLDKENFEKLKLLELESVPVNFTKVYHNEIDKNDKILKLSLDENLIRSIHKNHHNKIFKILEELDYEKSKLYEYSDISLIKCGKGYKFPIHDDTPNKLLSCVIYIYPNNNCGTILYENKKGHGKKIIEWKQNRNLIFSRIERKTWHSFESDGVSDRVALVYNLMTTQIKKVYKIEKKSYLIGKFRWKINPYLYNYFKFTI